MCTKGERREEKEFHPVLQHMIAESHLLMCVWVAAVQSDHYTEISL